jgi:hypothetical protein
VEDHLARRHLIYCHSLEAKIRVVTHKLRAYGTRCLTSSNLREDEMSADTEVESARSKWAETWCRIRRIGVFLLGVAMIIDAMGRGDVFAVWPELLIGALMVGAFPIESLPLINTTRARSTVTAAHEAASASESSGAASPSSPPT